MHILASTTLTWRSTFLSIPIQIEFCPFKVIPEFFKLSLHLKQRYLLNKHSYHKYSPTKKQHVNT